MSESKIPFMLGERNTFYFAVGANMYYFVFDKYTSTRYDDDVGGYGCQGIDETKFKYTLAKNSKYRIISEVFLTVGKMSPIEKIIYDFAMKSDMGLAKNITEFVDALGLS